MNKAILSVLGQDRPGIVAAISKILDQELRQRAKELSLEISIQHRNIFEAINRI
jgi:predicted amino acid-binding ACT domain protein